MIGLVISRHPAMHTNCNFFATPHESRNQRFPRTRAQRCEARVFISTKGPREGGQMGYKKIWAMYRIHLFCMKKMGCFPFYQKKMGGNCGVFWGFRIFQLPWLNMFDTSTRPDLGGLGLPRRNTGDSRCFSGPSLGQKFVAVLFFLSCWLFPFVSIELSKKKSWDDFIPNIQKPCFFGIQNMPHACKGHGSN